MPDLLRRICFHFAPAFSDQNVFQLLKVDHAVSQLSTVLKSWEIKSKVDPIHRNVYHKCN